MYSKESGIAGKAETKAADTKVKDALASLKGGNAQDKKADATGKENAARAQMLKQHPLLAVMQLGHPQSSVVGYVRGTDTAAVNKAIHSEVAKEILPADLNLAWSVNAENGVYELYALRRNNGGAVLAGEVVENAKDDYNEYHKPVVSMTMTPEGAREWATVTRNNLKKPVAIVLDGVVYSAPVIQTEINGGQSQISGNFTTQQTQDLANVLNSGKMPAPARIIQEDVVGPSLGQTAINNGLISFAVALLIIFIYMMMYYGFIPGLIADLVLIANTFFMLGILASFNAVLTLPGIAGIVLTLGMAVDANVVIFERIKEELALHKSREAAIQTGFAHAFWAIMDSNITTFIAALFLSILGTGPIKGFAYSLTIGVVSSVFTALFVSRLIFDFGTETLHQKKLHITWRSIA